MVLDATEARGGAEQAEAGPPVNHVARAPALHVAGDVPKGRDEVLDAVHGGDFSRNARTDGKAASCPSRLRTRGQDRLSWRPPNVSCRGVAPQ